VLKRPSSKFLDAVVALMPLKQQLLKSGARLSPEWKTPAVVRALAAIHRREHPLSRDVLTNLGITRTRLFSMPGSASPVYLYGTPKQYLGERGAISLALLLSKQAGCFVDIGAHLGYFSFIIAVHRDPLFPIHVIEPNPSLARYIEKNIANLELRNLRLHRVAIGEADSQAMFHVDLDDPLQSSLESGAHDRVEELEVQLRSFGSVATESALNNCLVKVDIENAEFRFLEGAAPARERIGAVIIEVLGPAHRKNFVQTACAALDMKAYYINDYSLEHAAEGKFLYSPPQYNWLFCRWTPNELTKMLSGTEFCVRGV
jgi:FkbM family methyltransferase